MRSYCQTVVSPLVVCLTLSCTVRLTATRWGGDAASGGTDGGTTLVDVGEPPVNAGLTVLTDTNRDGVVDDKDIAGFQDWSWHGLGAFLIANVDDDDGKGAIDASDQVVNGTNDENDLAAIFIELSPETLAKTTSIVARATAGAAQIHLFEKTSGGWVLVGEPLQGTTARIELGIEALCFADADWDGFVTVTVEVLGPRQSNIASQQVKMRVAPWLMLPNSARTELLYMSSSPSRLRSDINKVLAGAGLPDAQTSSPPGQDIWLQDTMEIGYTQLPGRPAMHVVMNAQRPNASDNVAPTLLAPDFGFISVGAPRQPANDEDYWMDWMGNLEVTHPVPGYPLGRIYYGRSERTTFHPTIVKFLEAQEVQKPFSVYVDWLLLQQADELMTFLPDQNGEAKMIIVSPAAANVVMGSGYDAANQQIQKYIDDEIALAKTELSLADEDIIPLPTLFSGSGTDFAPTWSNPVNAAYIDGTLMVGATNTPAAVRADIEMRLGAIGVRVAWVDDSECAPWVGYVHSATNTTRSPLCPSFTECLRRGSLF